MPSKAAEYARNYVPRARAERDVAALVETARSTSHLRALPVDAIVANPRNPRSRFQKRSIQELARSLREDGQLQPVLVRAIPGSETADGQPHYELIAGERRWRAAREAGLETIQAAIWDVTDEESLRLAIVENWHRENLTPAEEVAGLEMLSEAAGQVGVRELARRLRVAPSTISERLKVRRDPVVWPALESGEIGLSHAFHLRRAPLAARSSLLERVLAERPTRDTLDEWIREARAQAAAAGLEAEEADEEGVESEVPLPPPPAPSFADFLPQDVRRSNIVPQLEAAQLYLDSLERGLDPEARGVARHVFLRLKELLDVPDGPARVWGNRGLSSLLGRE